jgi:hypothetical protein
MMTIGMFFHLFVVPPGMADPVLTKGDLIASRASEAAVSVCHLLSCVFVGGLLACKHALLQCFVLFVCCLDVFVLLFVCMHLACPAL